MTDAQVFMSSLVKSLEWLSWWKWSYFRELSDFFQRLFSTNEAYQVVLFSVVLKFHCLAEIHSTPVYVNSENQPEEVDVVAVRAF